MELDPFVLSAGAASSSSGISTLGVPPAALLDADRCAPPDESSSVSSSPTAIMMDVHRKAYGRRACRAPTGNQIGACRALPGNQIGGAGGRVGVDKPKTATIREEQQNNPRITKR